MIMAIKILRVKVKASSRVGKMFVGNTMQGTVHMKQGVSLNTGVQFAINMAMGLTIVGEQMVLRNN